MSLTLSEEAKNELLNTMLEADQSYISKTWAMIVLCSPQIMKYAVSGQQRRVELLNVYAYIGFTEDALKIVTLSSLNVTVPTGYFSIPRTEITSVDIQKKFLSYTLVFHLQKERIRISFSLAAIGTNIKNQRKNVEHLVKEFE